MNQTDPQGVFESPPTLLCLNLRLEHVYSRRLAEVAASLAQAAEELATYRDNGWRVVHAYTVQARETGIEHGALLGFEAHVDEPVFAIQKLSALSDPQIFGMSPGQSIRLVGAAISRSGLATLLAAQDHGCRIGVVPGACFAPSIEALPERSFFELIRADDDGGVSVLKTDWGENVVCLRTRRH